MFHLLTLGSVDLVDGSGIRAEAVLSQPKRFALLVYLACARPLGLHRRDAVLPLFWPESDEAHARNALSQSLSFLRGHLSDDLIVTVGMDQIGLAARGLESDVSAFRAAVQEGRWQEATESYRGEFMPGFHFRGVGRFESWMEAERRDLELRAAEAAWTLARDQIQRGRMVDARRAANRAVHLAKGDEASVRSFMAALARVGGRASAVEFFEEYREILAQDLELQPADETVAVADAIRKGAGGGLDESSGESLWPTSDPNLDAPRGEEPRDGPEGETWGGDAGGKEIGSPVEAPGALAAVGSSRRHFGRGQTFLFLLALLAAAAAGTTYWLAQSRGDTSFMAAPGGDSRISVAVLPCEDRSPDRDDTHLAGGIHDEILLRLSRVSSIRSISPVSVEEYRTDPLPLRQMARELGADYVGECSIQKDSAANTIRVIFRLTESETGTQLLGQSYDRDLTARAILDIQREIARRVAMAIDATVRPEEERLLGMGMTSELGAHDLYWRGLAYWRQPDHQQQDLVIAESFWEQAIEIDPGFALAHARLSVLHGRMRVYSFDLSDERHDAQRLEAQEAVRLNPDLPEARFALAYFDYVDGDLHAAAREFEAVLQSSPSHAEAMRFLGYSYRRIQDWPAWERAFREASQMDPRNPNVYWNLGGITLSFLRRFPEAAQAIGRALELAPDLSTVAVQRGVLFIRWKGEMDSLRGVLADLPDTEFRRRRINLALYERNPHRVLELLEGDPEMEFWQLGAVPDALYEAWAYRLLGDSAAARHAFQRTVEIMQDFQADHPGDFRAWATLGYAFAGLGQHETAVESARRYCVDWPSSREDTYVRTHCERTEAEILAQAGLAEEAIRMLDDLLAKPSPLSVPLLRIDPIWDPIRTHPGFQPLLERYTALEESLQPTP